MKSDGAKNSQNGPSRSPQSGTYRSGLSIRSFRPFEVNHPNHDVRKAQQWWQETLPVDLEIGCGVGWHPLQYAIANGDRRLIAIEHTRAKFQRFARRTAAHGPMENLLAVHANAISWIAQWVPLQAVERCFILFPNPNPKTKHRNRRWHCMPFMQCLKQRLSHQGQITIATNERWYIEEAIELMPQNFGFYLLALETFNSVTHPDYKVRTHFEKKYFQEGQTIYQASWSIRPDSPAKTADLSSDPGKIY